MNKILLLFILFFCNTHSYSQKDISYYYHKAFPRGISSEIAPTDTILDTKNGYLEYSYHDGSNKIILFQAKMHRMKKGNDLFLSFQEISDMQCNWQKQKMFEIDSDTDSLISVPFFDKFVMKGYENFIEKDSTKKIYQKYKDSLKTYLHSDNDFPQFLEELYEYQFEFDSASEYVYVHLRFCDYIPTNIIGFTEDEMEFLQFSSYQFFEYSERKKKFMKSKKYFSVKF